MCFPSLHPKVLPLASFLIQPVKLYLCSEILTDIIFTDPTCVLLPPCDRRPITPTLVNKIAISLATRFDISVSKVRPCLRKAAIKQYGKVRRLDGGDTMNAATLVSTHDDYRDASFVRVSLPKIIPPACSYPFMFPNSTKCSSIRMQTTETGL
jgi:hypothetical protein